jgi:hypothetical protein
MIPEDVVSYIAAFDSKLTATEIESERFAYRLLFTKVTAKRLRLADVEDIDLRGGEPACGLEAPRIGSGTGELAREGGGRARPRQEARRSRAHSRQEARRAHRPSCGAARVCDRRDVAARGDVMEPRCFCSLVVLVPRGVAQARFAGISHAEGRVGSDSDGVTRRPSTRACRLLERAVFSGERGFPPRLRPRPADPRRAPPNSDVV